MSKLNEAKVMPRYMLVSVLMTLVSCCVLGKAFYIMTAEKDYWPRRPSNRLATA